MLKESTMQMLETVIRFCIRRRAVLNGIAILLAIWLIGGMVLLPYAVKTFLTKTWPEQTGRPASVAVVRFNPWRWALTMEQFQVLDADNTPLVSFEYLLVDYDMLAAFRLEFGLDAVELHKPYLKLAVDEAGVPGLLSLVPPAETPAPAPEPTAIPPVLVKRVAIQDFVVDYLDKHRVRPFVMQMDPVSFSLTDFHTRDLEHNNRIALKAHVADGRLAWEGQVRLDPLRIDGKLTLQDLALLPALDFALPERQFVLQSARLDAELAHSIEIGDTLSATVQQGLVAVRDIRVGAEAQTEPLIHIPGIVVDGIDVDVLKQTVLVNSIQLADGKLQVVKGADGVINLQQLFMPAPAVTNDAVAVEPVAPPEPASPWQVNIRQLALDNYAIHVSDQTMSPPMDIALAPIRVQAAGIQPLSAEPMDMQLSVGLPIGGEVALQSRIALSPVSATGELQVKQVPLSLAQPYVEKQAKIQLSKGTLEAALNFDVAQQPTLVATVSGSSAIRDLDVREMNPQQKDQQGQQRKVLSWNALELAGISYSLANQAVNIDTVTISKPHSRFVINADGTTNIQQLLVSVPAEGKPGGETPEKTVSAAQPAADKTSAPLSLGIKRISVLDGDLGFADLTLKPNFRVAIEKLQGTIDAVTTDPAVMARVNLEGRVDRYAPVTIKGAFNVLGKTPALDMAVAFKNIELTTFTPYSGTYAGFVIDKGQLSLDLDYTLVNNRIEGKNHIVMNQLQLGAQVENAKASDLPIRLAIALLKDENGMIDLGFEVNGSVDEPSFSIGGLFLKVLTNMVKKVVTAPFSLLAGTTDVPEEADKIAFGYGSAALDEPGAKKVAAVAALLQQRSMLRVNIRGNVLPDADRLGLQQQRLAAQLSQETGLPADQFLSPASAVEHRAPLRLVGRLYRQLRNETFDDLEDRLREDRLARQLGEDPAAVTLAAYEQAWLRLAETVPVTDAELKQLAMARASQVKTELMETHAIPPGRIFVLDAANGDTAPDALATLLLDAQ